MKINHRKLFPALFSLLIIVVILAPLLIEGKNEAKGFCVRVSSVISKIDQRITHYTNKLSEKRTEIQNRIRERRQKRSNRFEEKREKWDINRQEHFEKLEQGAETNEEKQAALEFKRIISQAIINRRTAVDTAIQDFRNGVDNLKIIRKSSINDLILAYKNEIQTAFDKAESDCEEGIDSGTVNKDLRSRLKQARDDFVQARRGIKNIKDEMQLLITAKKEAIKQAIDEFKTVMNQAVEDLETGQ